MLPPSDGAAALASFAERVDRLTEADLLLLVEAWSADDAEARHQAWIEVRALTDETGRGAELQELRDGLVRWAGVPSRSGLMPFSILVPSLRDEAAQRRASLAPLLDAGAALLLRDRLSAHSFAVLMHPWVVLRDLTAAAVDPEPEGAS
jgi:hypothetical protein